MPKTRQRKPGSRRLREATLKLLYACDAAEALPAELAETYWPLAQEHDRRRLAKARLGALRQFEERRAKGSESLARHDEAVLGVFRMHEEADEAREQWTRLRKGLDEIGARLKGIDRELRDASDEDTTEVLEFSLPEVFTLYRRIVETITALQDAVLPCAPARTALEPVEGALGRLNTLAQSARAVGDLEYEDEQWADLRNKATRLAQDREACQSRTVAIWDRREELDERISSLSENYRLERIDTVDRCILRQAIWEMLHDDGVPPLVALDEALELAKTFGSTDSYAFVNGILDRVYKEMD